MGTVRQTASPRVSDVRASILPEEPVGLNRARSRPEDEPRDDPGGGWRRGGRRAGWRERIGSAYGAVCKCYDLPLCSRSLFMPVLAAHLTRTAMAPMGHGATPRFSRRGSFHPSYPRRPLMARTTVVCFEFHACYLLVSFLSLLTLAWRWTLASLG
ncbi:hypothetical protein KM043_014634 [Ampulex compressa]|nr:hypothetical protein KM043_014634 [Ampulex compressa]